jgi:hypothetical protein
MRGLEMTDALFQLDEPSGIMRIIEHQPAFFEPENIHPARGKLG